MNAKRKESPAWDHPTSPWRHPHVLLNKVVNLPGCGCEVDGYGTLPKPVVIEFCPLHDAAQKLLEAATKIGNPWGGAKVDMKAVASLWKLAVKVQAKMQKTEVSHGR